MRPWGVSGPLRWSTTLGMEDSDLDILCLGHKFGGEAVFIFIL